MIHRRLVVTGRVQGVFFRDWTVATARALGLVGWVRNRRDGSVEAHVAGDAAVVARFVAACHEGPAAARVDGVRVSEVAAEPLEGFMRLPTA